jgi:hypothetical protein
MTKRTHDALVDFDRRRRHLPFMSASAFGAVVADIRKNGLPDVVTDDPKYMRELVRAARNAVIGANTQYGPLLRTAQMAPQPGTVAHELVHLNLQGYLQHVYGLGGSFMHLIDAMHATRPSTPESCWGIILYADEVEPGRELAARHERKLYSFYAAIRECGPLVLSNVDAWITLATHPSYKIKTSAGGFPDIMSTLLESMFCGPFDMRTAGVLMVAPDGRQTRVWLDLAMFLMDGAAHKELWSVKGDAGMFFCLLCPALCTRASELAQYEGERLLVGDFMPTDVARTCTATNASIRSTVRRLAAHAAVATAEIMRRREIVTGFNHNPYNILLNPRLDTIVYPESQLCHDGMHLLVANGVLNTMVFLLFDKAESLGLSGWEAFAIFITHYTWPDQHQAKGLYELFTPSRVEKYRTTGQLKCQASELLSILSVLAQFATQHLLNKGGMSDAVTCFLAGVDVADTYFEIPKGGVTPLMLQTRIETFAAYLTIAGWSDWAIPKFHWLVHLPNHLRKFAFLPACFVTERKHQTVKRYAAPTRNTQPMAMGVLAEVTAAHVSAMSSPDTFTYNIGLVKPRPASIRMRAYLRQLFGNQLADDAFRTAQYARYAVDGICAKRDVVLLQNCAADILAAEVWFHFSVLGESGTLVSCMQPIEVNRAGGYALWRKSDMPKIVMTTDIIAACIYRTYANGTVKTLLPRGI